MLPIAQDNAEVCDWIHNIEEQLAPIRFEANPVFVRILSNLPAKSRGTFTREQLALLADASRPVNAKHLIELRTSLPFIGRRFYLRLLLGKEMRNFERLQLEGQLGIASTSLGFTLIAWILLGFSFVGAAVVLYVIKSRLGIDLFDDPSLFHDLFYNLL